MKSIKLLTVLGCTLAVFALSAMAEQAKCCKDAAAEGKACTHKCCVAAAKDGKECTKCGGSGDIQKKDDKKDAEKKDDKK